MPVTDEPLVYVVRIIGKDADRLRSAAEAARKAAEEERAGDVEVSKESGEDLRGRLSQIVEQVSELSSQLEQCLRELNEADAAVLTGPSLGREASSAPPGLPSLLSLRFLARRRLYETAGVTSLMAGIGAAVLCGLLGLPEGVAAAGFVGTFLVMSFLWAVICAATPDESRAP
jgi:hypothetical protein